ncbi:phage holin family protein [Baekduia soli]|nr:phage holin family protein [Baekduia soli]
MTTPPATAPGGRVDPRARPTGELVKDLSTQVSTLVRQELELAKVELTEKGRQAGVGAGLFGGAGVFALYGAGALTAAAVLALATAVAGWLAAVIVGVAWLAVAGALALAGRARTKRAVPPVPEQAVETVKEDVRFTKEHVARSRQAHRQEAAR